MPNVHGTNGTSNRANILSNSSSNASVSSTSSSLNNLNNINKTNSNSNNSIATTMTTATDQSANDVAELDVEAGLADAGAQVNSNDAMNESIIILPEHRKLQISVSGKCEAISNNGSSLPTSPTGSDETPSTSRATGRNGRSENVWNGKDTAGGRKNCVGEEDIQRRRRPSNSHRHYDGFHIRQPDGR